MLTNQSERVRFGFNLARVILFLLLVVVLMQISQLLDMDDLFSRQGLSKMIDWLQMWGEEWGLLGPLVVTVLAVFTVVINIPTVIVLVSISIIYGPLSAMIMGIIYWAVACMVIHFIVQHLGGEMVSSILKTLPKKALSLVTNNLFRSVLYTRLIMFALPPSNWMLATLPLKARDFVMASSLGALPHILVWSSLGPRVINNLLLAEPGWWHSPEVIFIATYGVVLTLTVKFFLPNDGDSVASE